MYNSSDADYLRNASTDCLNNLIKNLANSLTTTLSVTLFWVSLQQQILDSFPFNFNICSNQLLIATFWSSFVSEKTQNIFNFCAIKQLEFKMKVLTINYGDHFADIFWYLYRSITDYDCSYCNIIPSVYILGNYNLVIQVTLDRLLTNHRSASIIYERWTISGVSVPMWELSPMYTTAIGCLWGHGLRGGGGGWLR